MDIKTWADSVVANIGKVIYGKEAVIKQILAALLAKGHVLLDDVPGLGKTMLARSLAQSIASSVSRIQSTPDLMPSDVLGVSVYNPSESTFKYRKGPIVSNFVLVDEINRATPRTQAALLEAMAELQISVEGKSIALPQPFFLIATQNPVDFEGTFPLPEAQKDRFLMTLSMGYPEMVTEKEILRNHSAMHSPLETLQSVTKLEEIGPLQEAVTKIHVSEAIADYILNLGNATRNNQNLRMGISPRGTLALYRCSQALAAINGRDYVIPDDIKNLMVPVFISRILLKPSALVKGLDALSVLKSIQDEVPSPLLADVHKS